MIRRCNGSCSTRSMMRFIIVDRLDRVAPEPSRPTASPRRRRRRRRWRRRMPRPASGSAPAIMDSSICVATMTGLPRARQAWTMRFCTPGTSSGGISTPRSPRATITRVGQLDDLVEALERRRLLDLGHDPGPALPISLRPSATSSGRCTKDSATQSTPSASAKDRSSRSLSVSGRDRQHHARQVDALVVRQRAADQRPRSRRNRRRNRSILSRILPSSSRSSVPGFMAAKISGCGSAARCRSPGVGSRSRRNASPAATRPIRRRNRRAGASDPAGRSGCRSGPVRRSASRSPDLRGGRQRLVVAAMAEVQPEHVDSGIEQRPQPLGGWRWPDLRSRRSCAAQRRSVVACSIPSARGRTRDGAKVIDIGQGRAGRRRDRPGREKAVAVVARAGPWRPIPRRPRGRVRVARSPRHCLRAVDPVGVAGQARNPGAPSSGHGKRQQELAVAAAAALAAHRDGGLAAGQQHAGCRQPVARRPAICRAIAACTAATSRASPSMRSPRNTGVADMPRSRPPRLRRRAPVRVGDQREVVDRREAGGRPVSASRRRRPSR